MLALTHDDTKLCKRSQNKYNDSSKAVYVSSYSLILVSVVATAKTSIDTWIRLEAAPLLITIVSQVTPDEAGSLSMDSGSYGTSGFCLYAEAVDHLRYALGDQFLVDWLSSRFVSMCWRPGRYLLSH